MPNVTIRMMIESFPVELSFDKDVSPAKVKETLLEWHTAGFMPPPSFQRSAGTTDVVGKFGNVVKVEPVERDMFGVTVKLDDIEQEFVFKTFSRGSFKVGERVRIIKNAKGFKEGERVTAEEEEEIKKNNANG